MLASEEWGEGRYKPLVMFAHTLALGAEAAHKILVASRDPKLRNFLARVEDKQAWLANYHSQVFFVVDPKFGREFFTVVAGAEFGEQIEKCLEGIKQYLSASPEERKRMVVQWTAEARGQKLAWSDVFELAAEFDELIDQLYEAHLANIREELKGNPGDDAAGLTLLTSSVRARFFLLVALPCWIEFGTTPTKLYECALSGHFKSLCMLLNLDQLCLQDWKIGTVTYLSLSWAADG